MEQNSSVTDCGCLSDISSDSFLDWDIEPRLQE